MFTCAVMVMLAFLGFTNFSRGLPLNDKFLHFLCFTIATGVFYFIVDVEEYALSLSYMCSRTLIHYPIGVHGGSGSGATSASYLPSSPAFYAEGY